MPLEEIQHFLISFEPRAGTTQVERFGADYDSAQAAYARAEEANGVNGPLDIVLISSDALETIEQTHSSYFGEKREKREKLSQLINR